MKTGQRGYIDMRMYNIYNIMKGVSMANNNMLLCSFICWRVAAVVLTAFRLIRMARNVYVRGCFYSIECCVLNLTGIIYLWSAEYALTYTGV